MTPLIVGTIFHLIILDGPEAAYKHYPEHIDYILDFMNSDFYKKHKL